MLFVNDFPVIRVAQGLLAILLLDLLLHFFYQLVLDRAMAVNIVRRNAGLSAV